MESRASTPKDNQASQYPKLMMSLQLGVAKSISVLPTQPIQVIMRQQQAALASSDAPRLLSSKEAFLEVWRQNQANSKGNLTALYRGTLPAMTKEFLKSVFYKGLLITSAPNLAASVMPDVTKDHLSNHQYHLIRSMIAGVIAGTGDVAFGGAFEAYATFRATSHGHHAGASFFKEFQAGKTPLAKLSLLYRGAVPSIFKGSVAFSTFFYSAQPIKQAVNQFYQVGKLETPPWYATLTAATLSGFAVAFTSSPFDIVKTQAQMPNASQKSLQDALKYNYQHHGTRGLMSGLPLKTLMVAVGWGIAFFATQRDHGKHRDKPVNGNVLQHH